MSNSVTMMITQEWMESLVGRDWEIFWKQEDDESNSDDDTTTPAADTAAAAAEAPSTTTAAAAAAAEASTTTTTSSATSKAEAPSSSSSSLDTSSKDVAAAAAAAASTGEISCTNSVVAPMEVENGINNTEEKENPNNATAAAADNGENNVEGDEDNDDDDDDDDESSSSSSSFAEDWYHGRVEGIIKNLFDSNSNNSNTAMFHVRFEGDDAIYDMALSPENVRPCAKTWIRRTRGLLDLKKKKKVDTTNSSTTCSSSSSSSSKAEEEDAKEECSWWELELAADTRMLADETPLQQIQQSIESEFRDDDSSIPIMYAAATVLSAAKDSDFQNGDAGGGDAATNNSENNNNKEDDFESILRLIVRLEQQIFLRSKLAPIVFIEEESSSPPTPTSSMETKKDDPPPSEAYCDYLVHCLKELKECCTWYCRAYPLAASASSPRSSSDTTTTTTTKMSRDDFMQYIVEGGRTTMARLISLDSSLSGFKRKRKRGPALIISQALSSSSSSAPPTLSPTVSGAPASSATSLNTAASSSAGTSTAAVQSSSSLTAPVAAVSTSSSSSLNNTAAPTTTVSPAGATNTEAVKSSSEPVAAVTSSSSLNNAVAPATVPSTGATTTTQAVPSTSILSVRAAAAASTAAVPCRRTKRQRLLYKNSGGTDCYWLKPTYTSSSSSTEQDATTLFLQDLTSEDFLSTPMVKRLVQSMTAHDKRWYSVCIGNLLLKLSTSVISPYVKWQRRAEYFLGDRETLPKEYASDGETSGEESDDDDDSEDGKSEQNTGRRKRRVKYEDIKALVDPAKQDAVLNRFDRSALVARLQAKLVAIGTFEEDCWNVIAKVLDEPDKKQHLGNQTHTTANNDETMKQLRALLHTANSKESAVGNVEPFGRDSSLTCAVLENAVVYRSWFLDLLYAETVRERVAMVDAVVTSLSKLPPLPSRAATPTTSAVDVSIMLDAIAPRVQALSAKYIDHVALFSRYMAHLSQQPTPANENEGIRSNFDLDASLSELRAAPVVSLAEEKIAVRRDVISWANKARHLLATSCPAFKDVEELKLELDSILLGQSPNRKEVVKNLRSNEEVETEVRAFAKSDVEEICKSNDEQPLGLDEDDDEQTLGLHQLCFRLYLKGVSWKDRCDAILASLRAYGNVDAGPVAGVSPPKATNMVDLKRIDDLLQEYQSLDVDLSFEHKLLRKVNEHALAWSARITSQLLDENASFEHMLNVVEEGNKSGNGLSNRPCGIIINPTRQVVDMLLELLRWHAAAKTFVTTMDAPADSINARLYTLLMLGIEVLELFNNSRQCPSSHKKFVFDSKETMRLLSERLDSRKPCRVLSRSKLESGTIALSVLSRVVDQVRDTNEGYPLMALLYSIWQIHAEDFAKKASASDADRSKFTIDAASGLNRSRPIVEGSSVLDIVREKNKSHWISEFDRLVAEGEAKEQAVKKALAELKGLLRDCFLRSDDVCTHFATLKDLQTAVRTQPGGRPSLALNSALEQQLEHSVKLVGWAVRALQFPVFRYEVTDSADEAAGDDRISYEVLVKLFDSRPTHNQEDMKDFACLVVRVGELYKAARAWQEEVSSLTMISLRGGKRRASPMKGEAPDNDEQQSRIDVGKVSNLSNNMILTKVSMPREEAIRAMSKGTEKFDVMLHDLFAKDYDGQCADKAPYPSGRSLVDSDGGLVIRRFTGSPLFIRLKEALVDIQAVANDVFAETPGKATFDWICRAVSWIDSLSVAMTHEKSNAGRLVLHGDTAKRLLQEGESVLLVIPDDLRRTLSSHGVFVSTNKDGNLTVKSKKGGSHHSLGTTATRWSPILLESLRGDISRTRKWEERVTAISKEVIEFHKPRSGLPVRKDESAVLQVHRFQRDISILSDECSDLVVSPTKGLIDAIAVLKTSLENYLTVNSNPEISRKAVEDAFSSNDAVVRHRFPLLDALVDRCAVASGPIAPPADDKTSKDPHFRCACRGFVEKALEKAIATMGVQGQNSGDGLAFARFKAWEIEEALFQEFQGVLLEKKMSKEYLEQAKALKRGLEDPENTTLCLRILAEEISAKSLTRISSDQLANPKVRRARAQAEAAARQSAVLTRDMPSSAKAKKPPAKPATKSISKEPTKEQKKASATASKKPGAKLGDIVKTVKTALPPPPPPSLAAIPLSRNDVARSSRGHPISSASGKDRFYLSLAEGKRKFNAGFYSDDDSTSPKAEGFLPDELSQTGRLPISEFCKFVSGKMGSGNWDTVLLRLVPATDADAREYKKFYKEYELKQRIAMLSLENGAKCFLLTPKFHKDAKSFLDLQNATSTYGVLLMRR